MAFSLFRTKNILNLHLYLLNLKEILKMKKTLFLLLSIFIAIPVFSQRNVSNDIFEQIKAINSLTIKKKVDINYPLLKTSLEELPGVTALNELLVDYENDEKWISDGIIISKDLKPFINVVGDTMIYSSSIKIDLLETNIDLAVKTFLIRKPTRKPLIIVYYADYTLFDKAGKEILRFKAYE